MRETRRTWIVVLVLGCLLGSAWAAFLIFTAWALLIFFPAWLLILSIAATGTLLAGRRYRAAKLIGLVLLTSMGATVALLGAFFLYVVVVH